MSHCWIRTNIFLVQDYKDVFSHYTKCAYTSEMTPWLHVKS